ncbi:MAG: ferritin-like protein [Minicystis sp.]
MKSRSIHAIVTEGINSVAQLQEALQIAIQLEFSTLPPYLCAEWSINANDGGDPSGVTAMVHDVVVQEMLHFGLACNMLTAIGGSPSIANASFVPTYPGSLPGGVHPGLTVDLLPLGTQSLATFMGIEYPSNGSIVTAPPTPPTPAAPAPPTIGEFYATIAGAFSSLFPDGTLPAGGQNQVTTTIDSDDLFAIVTVTDALNAISEITEQGEGTSVSPDEGTFDPNELAHYYAFAQIYYGLTITSGQGGFQYASPAITMPTVYPFSPQSGANQAPFISVFSTLLTQLQACWTSGFSIGAAIGTMFGLQSAGQALIQVGATPSFTFQAQ